MSRHIDADKLKSDIKEIAKITGGSLTEFEALGILSGQQIADVVEVVRCKNCKHGKKDSLFVDGYECSIFDNSNVEADDYCSFGERADT